MLVTATVEDRVPGWLKGKGHGWITAEYGMLPRSGRDRNQRESVRPNGRTQEIQRLIGRALRCVTDLEAMGERMITVDCDAIQADGGTRTASITGAYVAVYQAMQGMVKRRQLREIALKEPVAAISVGVVRGHAMLDLCYEEDSTAAVDMNVVMTASGKFVEVQGTGESDPFSAETLGTMLRLGQKGIHELIAAQREVLGL